jgi:NAD(P)-dependent dehydrogenase (short-subunit alcohol dehydrogenase family)
MDLELNDKTALVSGSTAGIGYAIADSLAAEGARVIINGRTPAAVESAVARLSAGAARRGPSGPTGASGPGGGRRGQVLGFAGDLAEASVAQRLAQAHPEVDILVNNLGIFEVRDYEAITDEDWRRFFEVNVLSGARLARLYLPYMKRRNWGRIIFISSESGLQIPVEMIHYGMTKAAQIAVARGLAELTAGTGITVNSVLPGPTRSRGVGDFVAEMAAAAGKTPAEVEKEFFATARPSSLLKRFATPEEVAAMVTYVASPRASATTGAALRVDGGVVKSAF